jgi:hypothetical protein
MIERPDYKTRFKGKGVGINSQSPQYGARFPEPYSSRLKGMTNKADYIRNAVMTYLDLKSRSLEILESTNNPSKTIDEALALIEENGLLDELVKRVDSYTAS